MVGKSGNWNLILDLTDWGQDFAADCSGAPENVMIRNHDWWNKYSHRIQKYKLKMEKNANCYEETECGCYAKDEEIPIENNKCVLLVTWKSTACPRIMAPNRDKTENL